MTQESQSIPSSSDIPDDVNKDKIIDKLKKMSKEDIAKLILNQHDVINKQSSKILEMINIVKSIDQVNREAIAQKNNYNNNLMNACKSTVTHQNQQMDNYEFSVKIQIILFILFILILFWLIYQTCWSNRNDSKSTIDSKSISIGDSKSTLFDVSTE
jgi:hypothetical protein